MQAIHFVANWNAPTERMTVELKFGGQTYIERMDKARWAEFIANLDTTPLTLGGIEVKMKGDEAIVRHTQQGIKDYLRKVDYAFQKTGSTTYLAG